MGKNDAMKQARMQMGLSQQELADVVGVTRQTIKILPPAERMKWNTNCKI